MKKIILTLLIFLFSTNLHSEIIKKLIINGNERISEETIKIYGEIDLNKDIKEADLNLILKNLYSTDFFEDVKVNVNNNVLRIDLKEYPIINQLILIGEKSTKYKDQIRKIIKLKEKRSLIKSYLVSALSKAFSTQGILSSLPPNKSGSLKISGSGNDLFSPLGKFDKSCEYCATRSG